MIDFLFIGVVALMVIDDCVLSAQIVFAEKWFKLNFAGHDLYFGNK